MTSLVGKKQGLFLVFEKSRRPFNISFSSILQLSKEKCCDELFFVVCMQSGNANIIYMPRLSHFRSRSTETKCP